ncbi:bifunctional ADP-dependent NAD(P)H-hydrate dehydratase/NAD(P)H-hydrate epimerase [Corynebacterium sp. 4HC-13]|uniref:bifunctional ADP-dependent NAD(P)H-hydrate dehydratase/NAD(P)H-hydrate epimerase n=1 Tax=Corynebacterium anserum TaxID=2684406 RepID=UPI00163B1295|nr:bifunctional ADP-dependent NAD(P)H-hydrate dehydratase/NAD(P)H-hydrate epimerase [Corynebacterium anserum]MBC2681980.1 bifunctional ADP-dependent NAD(P)H-hydrate dehydratase/NAD(P)H-hydrate epimerase [Corynebacterium anserum]
MSFLYTVEQVRQAENHLLAQQSEPDELMRSAAHAVAEEARKLLPEPLGSGDPQDDHVGLHVLSVLPERDSYREASPARVLLLVGPGGNGGDALYAGSELLRDGFRVSAFAYKGVNNTYSSARAAFLHEGGIFQDDLPFHSLLSEECVLAGDGVLSGDGAGKTSESYDLVIDGLFGLGGRGGVGPKVAAFLHCSSAPVLAIDIPSGVAGNSGALPPVVDKTLGIADHVRADVTVTFGGLRRAHGLSTECGRVICRDIQLRDGQTLSGALLERNRQAEAAGELSVNLMGPPAPVAVSSWSLASFPASMTNHSQRLDSGNPWDHSRRLGIDEASDCPSTRDNAGRPDGSVRRLSLPYDLPGEPGATSDKYSGGVVGLCAGSNKFPGAGILTATAAVRTTSSMVRWVGEEPQAIIWRNPEVVAHPRVEECGRVQAWVVGPGRGTDATAARELAYLLGRTEPLVVDADGLTLLAENPELMAKLKARSCASSDATYGATVALHGSRTLLTPHAGEFVRLARALERTCDLDGTCDLDTDRIGASATMARALGCTILLKGRFTVITDGMHADVVDAGSSWAATAGSGDVLSGIIGALLAERGEPAESALVGQFIHSTAAFVSAQVGEGFAPTSASRIAEKIPEAIAQLHRYSMKRFRVSRYHQQ